MTRTKPWREIKHQTADLASAARMDEYRRAMEDALALGRPREVRGTTQVELAGALGVTQANVSRIEHQDDLYLSTLREYVEALGGGLQIAAIFDDQTILLAASERGRHRALRNRQGHDGAADAAVQAQGRGDEKELVGAGGGESL